MALVNDISIDVRIKCISCSKEITIKDVPLIGLFSRYYSREKIQDCFPNMPREDREMFVSRTCDACYKLLEEDEE
jgi:hypothetical protein